MRVTTMAIVTVLAAMNGVGAAEPPRPHNVLLFVASGLRPGMVTERTAPTMAALLKRGVTFTNTHSLFPGLAMPNASAMATGHMPGDTGNFGNTIYTGLPAAGANGSATPSLASDSVLGDLNDHFGGNYLNESTILRAATAANISTAVVGDAGPGLIFDPAERTGQQTVIVDEQTGHPGGIPLSSDMQVVLHEFDLPAEAPPRGGNAGDAATKPVQAADGQRKWFSDVASAAVLATFKDRHKPFAMVFWSRHPGDTLHDQGDSPQRLIPGIDGPTSLASVKSVDSDLARLLSSLKDLGLDATTDVILASDHGASTISKESATSYAASRSYKEVPSAQLPPGFVAIDLAHALRMTLFDPDAIGDAKNKAVPDGSFPVHANGLIGDEAAHPVVIVAANGGSDLIYLPNPDKLMAMRIVQILSEQDYVSGVFVDPRLGSIGGTLPLSAVGLEGTALTPMPAIVVSFRSFSTGCGDPAACGVEVADTVMQQGQGAEGGFGRADTRSLLGAAGPDFRPGFLDPAPASNADVGTTVAAVLGLKLKDKGKQTGRVLTEAMPHGVPVVAKAGMLKSAPDDRGLVTELKYQTVGATRYFDAAGYPGRALGLD